MARNNPRAYRYPTYLGIKLDRSLTFKAHCESVSKKIAERNNLLNKLVGTKIGR